MPMERGPRPPFSGAETLAALEEEIRTCESELQRAQEAAADVKRLKEGLRSWTQTPHKQALPEARVAADMVADAAQKKIRRLQDRLQLLVEHRDELKKKNDAT